MTSKGIKLSLLAAAGCASLLSVRPAQSEFSGRPPGGATPESAGQTGRSVTLAAGRRIRLQCLGRGSPTVIFESGFGATSGAWFKVQPLVASSTRACSYDRAGYGFSDPGPLPRDGEAIARDLDRALRAAQINGPYILVGHSAGGLYARLLAGRRRRDVDGIVLVDPSVEYQDRRIAAVFGAGAGSLAPIRARVLRCLDASSGEPLARKVECPSPLSEGHEADPAREAAAWRTQLSELDTLFGQTSDEVSRMGDLLRDVPVLVLTASPGPPPPAPQDSYASTWQGLHHELAGRFRMGRQQIVQSSHLMMIDRPEIVSGAILEMVASSRKRRSPPR